jgi:hypothetical protein
MEGSQVNARPALDLSLASTRGVDATEFLRIHERDGLPRGGVDGRGPLAERSGSVCPQVPDRECHAGIREQIVRYFPIGKYTGRLVTKRS